MYVEQLRRGIEEQERRVLALRQEKQRRDALLCEVRGLINHVEPHLFHDLNSDTQELLHTLENHVSVCGPLTKTPTSSGPHELDASTIPLFSKEMEERIMQIEEQQPHRERRQRHQRHGERKKKKKGKRGATRRMETCPVVLTELEIKKREAVMAALDSLQLESFETLPAEKGVLLWLSDAETQHQQRNVGEEVVAQGEYSDDFEELTDVEG
ncbi:hypothetical protein MOQ_005790 [Trypanosoma cruzi marinkellei]|uniref:Uncharacterized protein n=1 Tax=Trypanosoma cruzi marinkellei TaxID=85056 RepID=K2MX91_TRYCR|nr:hypothetical protein MOQ_005790 [Trypanosoma cruzi marinkellei]